MEGHTLTQRSKKRSKWKTALHRGLIPEAFGAPLVSEVEMSMFGGVGPVGALCCLTKHEPARFRIGDAIIWLREDS